MTSQCPADIHRANIAREAVGLLAGMPAVEPTV